MDNLKINWLNIIFNAEFLSLIDFKSLKEISMVSKLARKKLKPLLFKNIEFSQNQFNWSANNIIIEYYKHGYGSKLGFMSKEASNESVNDFLDDTALALDNIKNYCQSFDFYNLHRPAVYLFSIANIFGNLTALWCSNCIVPFTGFAKLGESLPNLTSIKLYSVSLLKLHTQSISSDQYIIPKNLSKLYICNCDIVNTDLISDPYEYLFNADRSQLITINFTLPKVSIPALKKLVFYTYFDEESGLEEFLELNPYLETLYIEFENIELFKKLKFLKSLIIENVIGSTSTDQTTTLGSIINLKINRVGERDFKFVKNLCLALPNLRYLSFDLEDIFNFQHSIDKFISPILSNLPQLKNLKLNIGNNEDESLDISKFSKIESLDLRTCSTKILNINFENLINLKKFKFIYNTTNSINQETKNKLIEYSNWKFKFSYRTILGYKILN
ncbi:hypothetical protein CONCODRAFT_170592 [Conidiobolus coronatus NRRL 28638]|uniref:F-box domain-containing protein n=1 Tax=Conidiobolus coronatus (strain ATCC 28846 / CBS 209.66 / NRRL 28638) TaxID=796925 RepID=A0A137P6C9_CONC2|nr:hypothetical protein CONCODRAFT_170592 [Conidiobolus coronatus NRRL 28638]|eukprot:KXN70570.1 hypothetical protein CONCODRAFT_170592 [Conidiobolus coronatus NRRL 28638]